MLLLSGLLNTAGLLAFTVAQTPLAFALAYAVVGAGRALDSGPLEAWYVDAVTEIDPTAERRSACHVQAWPTAPR